MLDQKSWGDGVIALHIVWQAEPEDLATAGKCHIWAEWSQSYESRESRPSSKKTTRTASTVHTHPFALEHDALRAALARLVDNFSAQQARDDTLTLCLPSVAQRPSPSPELMAEQAIIDAPQAALRWWKVPTVTLTAGEALDVLPALPAKFTRGYVPASSTCFWIEVARFVTDLLARQAFVPAAQLFTGQAGTHAIARWQPVLAGSDEEYVDRLARALPPLCWAFVAPEHTRKGLPRALIAHFMSSAIDAFVREGLRTPGPEAASLSVSQTRDRRATKLAHQWLAALSAHDAVIEGSPAELTQFVQSVQSWLGQLRAVERDAPFRTCFRLSAPGEMDNEEEDAAHDPLHVVADGDQSGAHEQDDGKGHETEQEQSWHVRFFLQANDDRSLVVPAEKVWQERSGTLTFLKRKFENPQERLLADLAYASRLFPALEESLKSARPQEIVLDTMGAYHFLRESAPLLEQSGFGVQVPAWWKKPAVKLGMKLQVRPQSKVAGNGLFGLDSIVEYDWHVAMGESALTVNEFMRLVNLKVPLVKVRGQWVELRPEQIEAAINFLQRKRARGGMALGEALRMGLGGEAARTGLPVVGFEMEGWLSDVFGKLTQHTELTTIKAPKTFQGVLRPYQLKGVSWLAFLKQFGLGSCLADDMGLGKTIQLITLLLHEQSQAQGRELPPTLLICPMSIVGNWQREVQRFAPSLSVMLHHGAERLTGEAFTREALQHHIVITTYALVLRDREHLDAIEWNNIVLDEAQNIKNESAKQTQAIRSLRGQHRIALTGTPVENHLSELWSIMDFLNPGYLGGANEFRKHFAIPIERHHEQERLETLKSCIQPFVLRRVKTDRTIIQDLPDKIESKEFCNLTQEQASLYQAVVKEMMEKIEASEGIERRGLILATLLKLKQVCNHPAHFVGDESRLENRSGKLARLEEMLQQVLQEGDKALIFTQFAEMGRLLQRYLQEALGCETLFLYGGMPKTQRDLLVQRFQQEGQQLPIFILSLKAGGVGLNLTAANHVFHFDRWWNPAVENQATDRAFRIGQQKNVQVHKFVCVGTLEERIDQMIEQKKELSENIVGSGENWLTEMSTTQLKEIFKLSREAIGE